MNTPSIDPETGLSSVILSSINNRLIELKEDIREIKKSIDMHVTKETFAIVQEQIDRRIKNLELERNRVVSLVITAVIIAILGLVIGKGVVVIK